MHHSPPRSNLVADLTASECPLLPGIVHLRVYANDLDLLLVLACERPGREPEEVTKVIECSDPSLCPRMVARWLSARAMRMAADSAEAMSWADATAAEIMRRLREADVRFRH